MGNLAAEFYAPFVIASAMRSLGVREHVLLHE
jgi:hypothetical protein